MKRFIVSLFMVLAFTLAAAAHPPGAINITTDLKTMTVRVDLIHRVKNPKDHYIHEIMVKVNGKKLIKQEATEQITQEMQSVSYVVPGLKADDRITVTGDCNKIGDLTVEYKVKNEHAEPQPRATKKPAEKPEAKASSKFKVK